MAGYFSDGGMSIDGCLFVAILIFLILIGVWLLQQTMWAGLAMLAFVTVFVFVGLVA